MGHVDRTAELREAETQLQAAMLAGDAEALDGLVDERLVATVLPALGLVTKEQDLEAHRSGRLRLSRLDEEDFASVVADPTGMTRVVVSLEGTNIGEPFATRMVYTRTWHRDDEHGWRVLGGHVSPV